MQKIVSLRQALTDKEYFGSQLTGPSWAPWRALLLSIMGEELTADELTMFTTLTERVRAPLEPVREFCGCIWPQRRKKPRLGRLGGLSRLLR